jgi:putative oxidoreductase
MNKWAFSSSPYLTDLALALLRIGTGTMMLTHGWAKISNFSTNLGRFSDPIGLGPATSLQLAVFAEFFCAIFLILGFMTRISLLPLIITMVVAVFVIHGDDPFNVREKALLFLVVFITLFLLGPGKYSVDSQIKERPRY